MITLLLTARQTPGEPQEPAQRMPITGNRQGLAQLDRSMVELLRAHQVVGATLAVAKSGRLVLARGYGYADRAAQQPVQPRTLFCIASVTKPITAIAILKLVQQGKLRLNARLVDVLSDLKPLGRVVDPRVHDITIHHLLYHAGGWDVRKSGQPPRSMRRLARERGILGRLTPDICYRLALSQPLDFTPGKESTYSNFGFVILRLVIEHASGESYEQYVRQEILRPMRITRMRLEAQRPHYAPEETRRYVLGRMSALPGGQDLQEKSGNWLATATDLARFLVALDPHARKPFLAPSLYATMLAVPPRPWEKNGYRPSLYQPHVGLGWDRVQKQPRGWHYSKNGGRPGVHAWIEHRPDGVDWVVLLNTSGKGEDGDKDKILGAVTRRINDAFNRIRDWPTQDLFGTIP